MPVQDPNASDSGDPATRERSKILSRDGLAARRQAARAAGRRVVQCHGCFDIVHPGHIRHLRQAKSMGDILLVSITGDDRINKGKGRPLIPEELRAENLAAIDFIDWVYIDPNPTAGDLLARVQPDVYVKGREYEFNRDPRFLAEKDIVERAGGRVVFSSGDVVFSSTALIAAMEQSVDPFHKRLAQLCESPELQGPELFGLISSFRGKRVVVVGEVIHDTYVLCDRPEVAGESPIMTLRPLERRQYDGGAAILARHIAAMGGKPTLVTALPDGPECDALRQRLLVEGVELRRVPVRTPIAEKQRFLVGTQKVMKIDLVQPMLLDSREHDQLLQTAEDAVRQSDAHAAIIADFGLGLFTPVQMDRLCRSLRRRVGVLTGDVSGKRSSLLAMHGMDLMTPSEGELRDASRRFGEGLPLVVWNFLEHSRTKAAIVTMGPEGLIAFDRLPGTDSSTTSTHGAAPADTDGANYQSRLRSEHVPALCPMGVDPLGCGDSLLAAATLALASGASLLPAAFLGACAAASQVQRLGNIPISATDLRQTITRVQSSHLTFASADVIASRSGTSPAGTSVASPGSTSSRDELLPV